MSSTHTLTLADFLLARIAEDEAVARAASEGDGYQAWDVPTTGVVQLAGGDLVGLTQTTREAAQHIARHDPARVLAECEAKRRIVEAHGNGDAWCDYCAGYAEGMQDECHTGRLLALPYADHPDHRPEWRP